MSTLRCINRAFPFIYSHASSIRVSHRNLVSMEARRRQRRPVKKRRILKKEPQCLQEGESEILYSTHDDHYLSKADDEMEYVEQEPLIDIEEETHSKEKDKSREPSIDKLLPEIRKPIQAIGEYIYGPNAIMSALKSNKRPFYHRLYLSPIIDQPDEIKHDKIKPSKRKKNYNDIINLCDINQIPIEYCSKKELNHFVSKNMHQGFVLDCDPIQFPNLTDNPLYHTPNDNEAGPVWIAFDHLFNEENVGAVLRSALFFNVDGCIYSNKHCAPLSPLVATTSSGALDCMDIRLCTGLLHEYLYELKENQGWNIVGLDVYNNYQDDIGSNMQMKMGMNDEDGYDKYADIRSELPKFNPSNKDKPMVIVIGNESRGLSNEIRDVCNALVFIEGNPNALEFNVDSLNVASACSVALYQIMLNMNK